MTQKETQESKVDISLELDKTINTMYWKTRCLLAEKYIEETPCDPDIYVEQMEAYWKWINFKNETNRNYDSK